MISYGVGTYAGVMIVVTGDIADVPTAAANAAAVRAELAPDFAPLAKEATVTAAQSAIIAEIDAIPAPTVPTAAQNAAATVAAMNATPPQVDVRKINNAAVVGDGSPTNKWRGASV